jgi:hypothetical protein
MIDYEKKIIQIKEKINALTADLIVLPARLSHLERQRDQEAYQKFMRTHS